jgi:hypothetical protein
MQKPGCVRRALVPGLVALSIAGWALPRAARAQSVTGAILGGVRDSTDAGVPGASVSIVHSGTGFVRTVTTDARGEFIAVALPTGSYTVSAELTGFRKAELANVHVSVDQKVRVQLRLGALERADVVEVQAETPLLQTSASDLGTTVDGVLIRALPLNGRNFVSLTRTVPGVVRGIPGNNIDGAGSLGWRASGSFSANGQRPRDNNYLLDGVDNNESWIQSVVVFPSIDALDEFKLQTSTYSAEFGKSLGGVVSLQVKSGTNEYHGSAFGFLRDEALDANNFFNNRNGIARPPLSQYQFGGTLGGPIRSDRTFFFASYQGLRGDQPRTLVSTVPSLRMREGDFSEIGRLIYDPLTGQPFPGNLVPRGRWDPASANVMDQLVPVPNAEGSLAANGQTINNYVSNPNQERDDDQIDVKLDHQLSAANRFFVRGSYEKSRRFLPAAFPMGDGFGNQESTVKAQSVVVSDTHTFGSRWLNELRIGWSSFALRSGPRDPTNLAEQMGIPNVNLGEFTQGMSVISFAQGGIRAGNVGLAQSALGTAQPVLLDLKTLQIGNDLTHVRGRHTVKAGASVVFRSREILASDNLLGSFSFNQSITSNCAGRPTGCTPNTATGFDVASFALGFATVVGRTSIGDVPYTETRPEWSAYLQDDFRVSSRLTLNLGLRWDLFVPWVEEDDRQSNFDPTTGRFVVASEDAVIAGVPVGRHLQTWSKTDFGPRLGFAYDVAGNGRTILRGGFGVFWNWGPGGTSSSKAQNPPFLQAPASTSNFGTNLRLSAGPPPITEPNPDAPPAGTTRSAFRVDARDAYALNWNVVVEQQLGRDYSVELAYVGSSGRQLTLKTDQNRAPPVLGVTNPDVNRPYIQVSPALRAVGTVESSGTLDYHGLLVKLQRRFANGFSLLTAYTYAKAIDLASENDGVVSLTDVRNPGYNRGPADYDVTHTLSSAWTWELPIARRSRLGGFQVNGVLYWRTGLPVTVTQTGQMLSTGVPNNRPDRIGDGQKDDPTIEQWFDPTAFRQTAEPTATFGTSGRNILRGPGQFNIDLSLVKLTRFGKVTTELRVEAFNLLNHPQFQAPVGASAQFGNPAFGTITAMLSNPACATCGTTERQVQLGLKLRF